MEYTDREELERAAEILAQQSNRLFLNIGLGAIEKQSSAFRQAEAAYEALVSARKTADPVAWERTKIDGRNGEELMQRIWDVRQELRRLDRMREILADGQKLATT